MLTDIRARTQQNSVEDTIIEQKVIGIMADKIRHGEQIQWNDVRALLGVAGEI